jgi:hypothetical protein
MSKEQPDEEMRTEYDFTAAEVRGAQRGKYAERYQAGVNVVTLDPDVAAVFPDSDAVNRALRALAGIIRDRTSHVALPGEPPRG